MIQWGFPSNCLIWTIREMEQREAMDTVGESLATEEALAIAWLRANSRSPLERLVHHLSTTDW
jgi:hypothetical protein